MNITIHRGIDQIGGCITEISTDATRIFIDMGDNLPGVGKKMTEDEKAVENERLVTELFSQNKRETEAVFYTHSHPDHTGMLEFVPQHVEQFMSRGTQDLLMLREEVLLKRDELIAKELGEETMLSMVERMGKMAKIAACAVWERPLPKKRPETICVGDIRVTPYFVSHSTYDAHMLLVEANGQRILHTGDYRRHGYLGKGLLPTLKNIGQVDYLITEGTMLGRAEACESEAEVSRRMADVMRAFKYVFVLASATDIERLAAVNDAAKKSGRMLMASSLMHYRTMSYFSEHADYTADGLFRFDYYKYSEKTHSRLIKKMLREGFAMVKGVNQAALAIEMQQHFDPAQTLLIYSSWDGYYKLPEQVEANPAYKIFRDLFPNVVDLHTAGHADRQTIAEVIKTVSPRRAIIGIHKEKGTSLTTLDLPEELKAKIVPENQQPENIKISVPCDSAAGQSQ